MAVTETRPSRIIKLDMNNFMCKSQWPMTVLHKNGVFAITRDYRVFRHPGNLTESFSDQPQG